MVHLDYGISSLGENSVAIKIIFNEDKFHKNGTTWHKWHVIWSVLNQVYNEFDIGIRNL